LQLPKGECKEPTKIEGKLSVEDVGEIETTTQRQKTAYLHIF
jgi:hypothetical protein